MSPWKTRGPGTFEFSTVRIDPPASFTELDDAIEQVTDYQVACLHERKWFSFFHQQFPSEGTGDSPRLLKGVHLCAIGARAAAAGSHVPGMNLDLVPEEFHSEGLVRAFARS